MFQQAKPVFYAPLWDEMNIFLGFYARVPRGNAPILRIAGANLYAVYVNGEFIHSGPARAAHDLYRVDELPLALDRDSNLICVTLTSYHCNSFSLIDVPGFLCAEVVDGDQVLAHTDENGSFTCVRLDQRLQKVRRYSPQRNFTESYRLDDRFVRFFTQPEDRESLPLTRTEEKNFIPRELYYPLFETELPTKLIKEGRVRRGEAPPYDQKRWVGNPKVKIFSEEELEYDCMADALSLEAEAGQPTAQDPADFSLAEMTYADLQFQNELTGFLQLELEADTPATLLIEFDEVYYGDQVDLRRWLSSVCSCITLFLEPGQHRFMTMEPYSMKYVRLICTQGGVRVRNFRLRRAGYPDQIRRFPISDPELKRIYQAAIENFRQNTYDIYMDCPSRERTGFLCDSFFTSRSEYGLTGKSEVERVFLGNYIYARRFPSIHRGMLPMCYPADHVAGNFIANWALWFLLELEEYLSRTGDRKLIEDARDKVFALMDYMKALENEFGMLEKVPKWVFVEWSRSNDLVQDVNYPSNMLYARAKRAVAAMYDRPELVSEAEQMECYIRENTMVNGFFCDNSLRQPDGTLRLSGECTESCQYYAFFMNIATPESHPELWNTLMTDFGPHRKQHNRHPEIAFSNAFIGNFLRLDLLARYGRMEQLLEEIRGYFLFMADTTGTLWEHDSPTASCNHGFASYTAVLLQKALSPQIN